MNCYCWVAQLCLALCDPMSCSPPGFSVHGISQARILEWVAISSSRGSSGPRDWTSVSCIAGRLLYHWATGEAPKPPLKPLHRENQGFSTLGAFICPKVTSSLSSVSTGEEVHFTGTSLWHRSPPLVTIFMIFKGSHLCTEILYKLQGYKQMIIITNVIITI